MNKFKLQIKSKSQIKLLGYMLTKKKYEGKFEKVLKSAF